MSQGTIRHTCNLCSHCVMCGCKKRYDTTIRRTSRLRVGAIREGDCLLPEESFRRRTQSAARSNGKPDFGCFGTVAQQMNSGLSLLKQWERNKLKGKHTSTVAYIDSELSVALARLQPQLEFHLAMNPMSDHPLTKPQDVEIGNDLPIRFAPWLKHFHLYLLWQHAIFAILEKHVLF
jgi:hypothetical protein